MTWESPSEKRIREYMESDGNGDGYIRSMEVGGIAPYRVAFWSQRGHKSLLEWANKYPNDKRYLSQIPAMANAIFDEALEYNQHWDETHEKLNNKMTESEEKIHEHIVRSQGYKGNPYRNDQWTDRQRGRFLTWAEQPSPFSDELSFLANMAQMIVAEAYEYHERYVFEGWKPGTNTPVDEDDFQELLRQHQELATLRARLKKMDDQAVQEQRRLKNKMEREHTTRYYAAIHQDPDQTLKIYEYL